MLDGTHPKPVLLKVARMKGPPWKNKLFYTHLGAQRMGQVPAQCLLGLHLYAISSATPPACSGLDIGTGVRQFY